MLAIRVDQSSFPDIQLIQHRLSVFWHGDDLSHYRLIKPGNLEVHKSRYPGLHLLNSGYIPYPFSKTFRGSSDSGKTIGKSILGIVSVQSLLQRIPHTGHAYINRSEEHTSELQSRGH